MPPHTEKQHGSKAGCLERSRANHEAELASAAEMLTLEKDRERGAALSSSLRARDEEHGSAMEAQQKELTDRHAAALAQQSKQPSKSLPLLFLQYL